MFWEIIIVHVLAGFNHLSLHPHRSLSASTIMNTPLKQVYYMLCSVGLTAYTFALAKLPPMLATFFLQPQQHSALEISIVRNRTHRHLR